MDVLDFPFFLPCCLSMSNAQSCQIFNFCSSDVAMYSSASARAVFNLVISELEMELLHIFCIAPNCMR